MKDAGKEACQHGNTRLIGLGREGVPLNRAYGAQGVNLCQKEEEIGRIALLLADKVDPIRTINRSKQCFHQRACKRSMLLKQLDETLRLRSKRKDDDGVMEEVACQTEEKGDYVRASFIISNHLKASVLMPSNRIPIDVMFFEISAKQVSKCLFRVWGGTRILEQPTWRSGIAKGAQSSLSLSRGKCQQIRSDGLIHCKPERARAGGHAVCCSEKGGRRSGWDGYLGFHRGHGWPVMVGLTTAMLLQTA